MSNGLDLVMSDMEKSLYWQKQGKSNKFYEALRTVFEVSKQDGSGGKACRDLLLALYNGDTYPFNMDNLRKLDFTNHEACMVVIQIHTMANPKEIHRILPEYSGLFLEHEASRLIEDVGKNGIDLIEWFEHNDWVKSTKIGAKKYKQLTANK